MQFFLIFTFSYFIKEQTPPARGANCWYEGQFSDFRHNVKFDIFIQDNVKTDTILHENFEFDAYLQFENRPTNRSFTVVNLSFYWHVNSFIYYIDSYKAV